MRLEASAPRGVWPLASEVTQFWLSGGGVISSLCAEALNCARDPSTCVMKLIAHEHCRRRVWGCRIYNSHLLPSALSENCDSSLRFWCCHYGSLWRWQRWSRGVDGCRCGAHCHYFVCRVACARRFQQNGRGPTTWLPLRGATDNQHRQMLHTFICCLCWEPQHDNSPPAAISAPGRGRLIGFYTGNASNRCKDVTMWRYTNVDSHTECRTMLSWRVYPTQYNNTTSSLHSYK